MLDTGDKSGKIDFVAIADDCRVGCRRKRGDDIAICGIIGMRRRGLRIQYSIIGEDIPSNPAIKYIASRAADQAIQAGTAK